jgi:hypothetical protein
VSANRLAKETGIRQQNLSRWLQEARNLGDHRIAEQYSYFSRVLRRPDIVAGSLTSSA